MKIILQLNSAGLEVNTSNILKHFEVFKIEKKSDKVIYIEITLKNEDNIIDTLSNLDNIVNMHLSSYVKYQNDNFYYSNL